MLVSSGTGWFDGTDGVVVGILTGALIFARARPTGALHSLVWNGW